MSIALATAVVGAAVLLRDLPPRVLIAWIAASIALGLIAGLAALETYPWNNLVVASIALSAGVGIGRIVPPRFLPMLALLTALSVLDIVQVALTSGPAPGGSAGRPAAWMLYVNFRLVVDGIRIGIGIFDLLLAAAISVHLMRRRTPWPLSVGAAPLGLVLADGFVVVTHGDGLPLVPFLTVGWLAGEAAATRLRRDMPLPTRP